MESDLRTPAARLRAGLDNLSATLPTPGARPLSRATAGQPRPLGALLAGRAGSDQPKPEPTPPRPEWPGGGGGPPPPLRAAPQTGAAGLLAEPVRQAAAPGLGRPAPAPG